MSGPSGIAGSRRPVAAAAVGNILEWYDFSVYLLFAPYIAAAIFPGGGAMVETVKALLVFGVGFVARPLGALAIGYYGDVAGRRAALTLTFTLMALGTLLIACAPTHASAGAAAPMIVLAGRLLQGFSAGGEIGGAAAFLIEHSPSDRRGVAASGLQASMALSNILGAIVVLGTGAMLSEDAIASGGWRLPFLLGLAIVPIGLWLRAHVEETPSFIAGRARSPLRKLKGQGRAIATGFGLSALWGVGIYALVIFMPVFLRQTLAIDGDILFLTSILGNLALLGGSLLGGCASDQFGRWRTLALAAMALLLTPLPLLALVGGHATPLLLFVVQPALCIVTGLYAGAAPAALAELYPAPVRSTATSIAYNAAITPLAGFGPALILWLSTLGLGVLAPAFYVALAVLIAAPAILIGSSIAVEREHRF